jgi:S-adenosylmethionine decarboxylase proenzyme
MSPSADVLPNPVFEGSEKRIEIDFQPAAGEGSVTAGLRALSRCQLDELMTLARCTIVSSRTNAHFDAYVLSESSLFVYPTKWVLKTCGTTRLLNSVPRLLELASGLGLEARRCKYTRASFLFPEQQASGSPVHAFRLLLLALQQPVLTRLSAYIFLSCR